MVNTRTIGLAAVSLALLSGCGGAGSPPSEEKNASKFLIGLEDLPPGARMEKELPEPCGPLPTLELAETKVAKTNAMVFGDVIVKEAVGLFPEAEKAESAYEGLTEEERTECIRDSLEPYYPKGRISITPATSLSLADEGSDAQYPIYDENDTLKAAFDAVSMRSGSCVLTLLFLRREEAIRDQSVPELGETAVSRLPSSCG